MKIEINKEYELKYAAGGVGIVKVVGIGNYKGRGAGRYVRFIQLGKLKQLSLAAFEKRVAS
jgi:hypothetical protein